MAEQNLIEQELAKAMRTIERKGNGPVPTEVVKQGVADDLARFIETHADDVLKEAEQLKAEAYDYAKEIRERTAEQIARLKAFTDSIKQSQTEMSEVRLRFVSAGTSKQEGDHGNSP